ncbi:CTLH domain-containing protein [Plasmodiophora brassicae]|uniref:CTLH domain-containing protein n=1 Tax=Plasmodiophora brassicae TaxID=37360 RepID=A0A3P3YIS8_PLABS|nr:unnamed protein product [Plasmodiophora brassicae]
MQLHIRHDEIILLILDYLKRHGCPEAMRCLERESMLTLETYGREVDFLRQLVLDGQWDDAHRFIEPLRDRANFDHRLVTFELRRQRFLELVDSQDLSSAVVELVEHLKALEDSCSKSEFNALCYCLTVGRLRDHPDYRFWSVHSARQQCFERIRTQFDAIYPQSHVERQRADSMQPNRLVTALKHSILYQLSLAASKSGTAPAPDLTRTFTVLRDIDDSSQKPDVQPAFAPEESPTKPPAPVAWDVGDVEGGTSSAFQCVSTLSDSHAVRSIRFSAQARMLAIGSASRRLRLAACTDDLLRVVHEYAEHHAGSIYAIDWSADGLFLATGSNDRMAQVVRVADLGAGTNCTALRGTHPGTVRAVRFRPRASHLLTGGSGDFHLRQWDYLGGSGEPLAMLTGHTAAVFAMAASADGQTLISGGADRTVRQWDLRSGTCVAVVDGIVDAPVSDVSMDTIARTVYAGYADGRVAAFDLATRRMLWREQLHSDDCRSVSLSPDDQLLLTGSFDSSMAIVDARYGDTLQRIKEHTGKVVQVEWHPVAARFASCSADRTVKLWSCQR